MAGPRKRLDFQSPPGDAAGAKTLAAAPAPAPKRARRDDETQAAVRGGDPPAGDGRSVDAGVPRAGAGATATAAAPAPKGSPGPLLPPGPNRRRPPSRPPVAVIHPGVSEPVSMFPETQGCITRPRGQYNAFERETERELAQVFGRFPRVQPRPGEIPHYPYLSYQHPRNLRDTAQVRITFRLGYNPFSIN
ncbi:ORF4 [Simian torque teno virus 31]|uniref:ORF4 n=1 Tax=Simian torque teno virus 31 TaxID=1619219 RepID=A0A0C5IA68_9VIRU|nr:ORF4 [Simian torque teno virus 31]AJP36569.1 ORF4 [Simian torque teno virus 31]